MNTVSQDFNKERDIIYALLPFGNTVGMGGNCGEQQGQTETLRSFIAMNSTNKKTSWQVACKFAFDGNSSLASKNLLDGISRRRIIQ